MFATKHRIVTDGYAGYEVQFKVWWWPFWMQKGGVNTFHNLEDAKVFARGTVWTSEDSE